MGERLAVTATDVIRLLDRTLQLGSRTRGMSASTPLLGAIPELDSMAVVAVLTSIEEEFGIQISDDEVTASDFATVETFVTFVNGCLSRQ